MRSRAGVGSDDVALLRLQEPVPTAVATPIPIARSWPPYGKGPRHAAPGVASAFIRNFPGATGPNAQRVSTLTFGFVYRISLLVAEAQRSGEVACEVDPMACAQNLFGLYFMALMAWLSGHASLESALVPLLRDALALQIRGFRP